LSSKISIGYIDIRVFSHATEDTERVLNAVRNMFPPGEVDNVVFKKNSLTGHHGNQIVLFETRIKEKKAVEAIFCNLSSGLSSLDKEQLSSEIKQHLEKGNLYIRLDKQSAYLNELKLNPTDSIHLRIHFQKSRPEDVIGICRKYGMLP
jgi:RNA binding exosome subunit